jgi:hypothetical protein
MKLSRAELSLLKLLTEGHTSVKEIAKHMKRSEKQTYMACSSLRKKEIIILRRGTIIPKSSIHVSLLLQLLSKHPHIIDALSDSAIPILSSMLQPRTIEDIMTLTGYKRSVVFSRLSQARKRSIIIKSEGYALNHALWQDLIKFIEALNEYELNVDSRIPVGSIIYNKTDRQIVFSTKHDIEAAKTAFSAYEEYGIKVHAIRNYFRLPNKKLSRKDILLHSLYVAEKEHDTRHIILIALFYLKTGKSFGIKHPIIMNIKIILKGGAVKGYPSYDEIMERAELYGIGV